MLLICGHKRLPVRYRSAIGELNGTPYTHRIHQPPRQRRRLLPVCIPTSTWLPWPAQLQSAHSILLWIAVIISRPVRVHYYNSTAHYVPITWADLGCRRVAAYSPKEKDSLITLDACFALHSHHPAQQQLDLYYIRTSLVLYLLKLWSGHNESATTSECRKPVRFLGEIHRDQIKWFDSFNLNWSATRNVIYSIAVLISIAIDEFGWSPPRQECPLPIIM